LSARSAEGEPEGEHDHRPVGEKTRHAHGQGDIRGIDVSRYVRLAELLSRHGDDAETIAQRVGHSGGQPGDEKLDVKGQGRLFGVERVGKAGHRHPVLRLGVVDRVAANDRRPGCARGVGATAQHVGQRRERQGRTPSRWRRSCPR